MFLRFAMVTMIAIMGPTNAAARESIKRSINGDRLINGVYIGPLNQSSDLSFALPKFWDRAKGFTAYGESCKDRCLYRGQAYKHCTPIIEWRSNYGSVGCSDAKCLCSTRPDETSLGIQCSDACEKRDEEYYWCHKKVFLAGPPTPRSFGRSLDRPFGSEVWGYCTPKFLLDTLNED